jgi:hypothetical protein
MGQVVPEIVDTISAPDPYPSYPETEVRDISADKKLLQKATNITDGEHSMKLAIRQNTLKSNQR